MKIINWLFTALFGLAFLTVLGVFHIFQVIALRVFGYEAHKKVVDGMIASILTCLGIVAASPRYEFRAKKFPMDRPMIIVSNHQSMFDIPAIGWALRKHHPKYISKKSLAKGIPSVSYNIRNGGSITIDRKKPEESKQKIKAFTIYLNENNRAGCLFAEGTRSKDGRMTTFKKGGFYTMLDAMPDATIVPVALENFWKITRYGFKPIPFAARPRCTVLPAVEREGKTNEMLLKECEDKIRAVAEQNLT